MTAPLIQPLLAAPEGLTLPSGAEPVASGEFELTLGAALASVVAAARPILPSPSPGTTTLADLFADGHWVLGAPVAEESIEESTEESVETDSSEAASLGTGGRSGRAPTVLADQPESLSLERGLELWLTRIAAAPARVEKQAAGDAAVELTPNGLPPVMRPRPAQTGFGVEMQLRPDPVLPARPGAAPGVAPPRVIATMPAPPELLPGIAAGPGKPTTLVIADRRPPTPRRPDLDGPLPTMDLDRGVMDLDQGVSVAVMLGRRAAVESAIEIAGFGFPAGWPQPGGEVVPDLTLQPPMSSARSSVKAAPANPAPLGTASPRSGGVSSPIGLAPTPTPWGVVGPITDAVVERAEGRPTPSPNPIAAALPETPSPETAVEPHRPRIEGSPMEPLPPRVPGHRMPPTWAATFEMAGRPDRQPTAGGRDQPAPKLRVRAIEPATPRGDDATVTGFGRPVLAPLPIAGAARGLGPVDATGPATAPVLEPTTQVRREEVFLELGDEQNDLGRIRVAIHGSSVRATIMPNDPEMAQRLTTGLRELRQSLEERGFADPRVFVQAPRPVEPGAATVAVRDLVAEAGASLEPKGSPRHSAPDDRRDRGSEPSARQDPRHRSPDRQRQNDQEEETER